MDSASVRQAGPEDLEKLQSLFSACASRHRHSLPPVYAPPEGRCPSEEAIKEFMAREDATVLIAEQGDRAVGTVQAALHHPAGERKQPGATIDCLVVRGSHQRTGVGRALMEAAHRWASENGAAAVELNVWEFNREAVSFYGTLGYRTVSRKMWMPLRSRPS